jgi:hypothetical protein
MQYLIKKLETATPDMIASFVAFLCIDAAANVNGYDIPVNAY